MTDDTTDKSAAKPCPICGKPAIARYRPFCSSRCADVDLHRWLSGGYSIPGNTDEDEDGDEVPLVPRTPDER